MFQKLINTLLGRTPEETIKIHAVCDGTVVSIKNVPDPTFAEEMLGSGVAIQPTGDTIVSPIEGTVASVFPTLHAVTLESKEGAEVLIHIGLDTVNRKGDGFSGLVHEGDSVQVGTPLVRFDKIALEEASYNMITPILICNTDDYELSPLHIGEDVKAGDLVLELKKKSS